MRIRFQDARRFALAAFFSGTLIGCGASDGGGHVEVGITSSAQPLAVLPAFAVGDGAIDADAGPLGPRLILTVARVDVHVAGDDDSDDNRPPGPLPPNDDDGGWVTIFSGLARVDLLLAGSVETFLAAAPVPAGKITQIRLVLSDATWIDGAASTPVTCPSCTQTGLKIVTMGKVMVPRGGTIHITLDFDRERSLRADKDGYRLDPVVKIVRTHVR
jgi:hypothetical protein